MPFVTVKVIENVFTPEEKSEMIRRITDTMAEIEGESLRPNTWVVVEEVRSGDWGIGGQSLTHRRRQDPRPRPLPSSRPGLGPG
jgi:4-oxalocrotonate tautomerase